MRRGVAIVLAIFALMLLVVGVSSTPKGDSPETAVIELVRKEVNRDPLGDVSLSLLCKNKSTITIHHLSIEYSLIDENGAVLETKTLKKSCSLDPGHTISLSRKLGRRPQGAVRFDSCTYYVNGVNGGILCTGELTNSRPLSYDFS